VSARHTTAACIALVLVVTGCAADAQRAGRDDAAANANAITFLLRSGVVRAGVTPVAQFARVEGWLSKPPLADLKQVGYPAFRVLASHPPGRIDIAVWAYGETTAIEGKNGAWGHVCSRYTVDAASRLVAKTITCPSGLPQQPD
jgi:hypothetical protein